MTGILAATAWLGLAYLFLVFNHAAHRKPNPEAPQYVCCWCKQPCGPGPHDCMKRGANDPS